MLKCSFKDTEAHCRQNGFVFQPMILEAHGGSWSPAARRVLDMVASSMAAVWNERQESASLRVAQRLSCSLQRENARAILRRLAKPDLAPPSDDSYLDLLPPL